MSEDQFTKLFKYIEDFRKDVDKRFVEAATDRADIRGAIAELSVQVRDYHNEMKFMSHQMVNYAMQYFKLPKKQV